MSNTVNSSVRPPDSLICTQRPSNKTAKSIDFILVPACGIQIKEPWRIKDWLRHKKSVGVLQYNHGLSVDNNFTTEKLLLRGQQFLKDVHDHWRKNSESGNILVIIAHGLGGFMVKEALAHANENHDRYEVFLSSISGLIFLGTPHPGEELQRFASRLKGFYQTLYPDLSSKTLAKLTDEESIDSLTGLARRFIDTNANLNCEILILYETKETRPSDSKSRSIFASLKTNGKAKDVILVDKALAGFKAERVKTSGVYLDHFELPRLEVEPEGEANSAAHEWIDKILSGRPKVLPSAIKDEALRSPNAIDIVIESATARSSHAIQRRSANYALSRPSADTEFITTWINHSRRIAIPSNSLKILNGVRHFWGREDELEELDRRLLPHEMRPGEEHAESPKFAAICGSEGLGKTTLAFQWAQSRKDKFDAIFWIQSDSKEKLQADFSNIPLLLRLSDATELQNPLVNSSKAKNWLLNPTKRASESSTELTPAKWLMVLDNLDEPELLRDMRQFLGKGSILVTSRDPRARQIITEEPIGIELAYLNDLEAGDMLRKLCPDHNEDGIDALTKYFGGSPLTLALLAAYIRTKHLTFANYLKLREDEEALGTSPPEMPVEGQHKIVHGVLSDMLGSNALHENSQALLNLLCFMDADRIQDQIFDKVNSSDLRPERGKLYSRRAFVDARAELLNLGIIESRKQGKVLSMHRTIQELRLNAMSSEDKVTSLGLIASIILYAWPDIEQETDAKTAKQRTMRRWKECAKLYPHVICIRRHYEKLSVEEPVLPNIQIAKLLYACGWWEHDRGNSRSSKSMLELARSICEGLRQEDEFISDQVLEMLGDIHYALSVVANATNDSAACFEHTQESLRLRRETNIPSDQNTRLAIAYNEAGIAFMMRANWRQGEEHFNSAIAQYQQLKELEAPMLSLPYANLGWSYFIQNKLDEAYSVLTKALEEREKSYGKDDVIDFRAGRILHALGNTEHARGRRTQGQEYHRRALVQYIASIGSNHRRTADLCCKVARSYAEDEDHQTARLLLGKALEIWKADSESHKAQIARAKFLLSRSYEQTNEIVSRNRELDDARGYLCDVHRQLGRPQPPSRDNLQDFHFDDVITFWSR